MKQPRRHRVELKTALKLTGDARLNAEIVEIFDDLQKQRDLYRDQLTVERAAHKKLKDERRGMVRDVDYSVRYVWSRMTAYDEFELYYDTNAERFAVITKRKMSVNGYELIGAYRKPYDRHAIREDIEFYLGGE